MKWKGNLILLLVAMIWGGAFSAQRAGMEYIGPFAFNGVRFVLGCLSLIPLLLYFGGKKTPEKRRADRSAAWRAGMVTGLIITADLSCQQFGLVYTTAGKAAFITCLYLILVPLAGVCLRRQIKAEIWAGALLSLVGLYFLCVTDGVSIAYGDWFIFGSAVFGAIHILAIGYYARHVDALELAFSQFFICAVISLAAALAVEDVRWAYIEAAAVPILYGGVLSVGGAYTLQIVGQKYADPSHAVIIMSLESVFGAIGGYIFLGEILSVRQAAGCVLMFAGVLGAQYSLLRGLKLGMGKGAG